MTYCVVCATDADEDVFGVPFCYRCSSSLPEKSIDKIVESKYNATKPKEGTMCCNDRDDFIKFQCKHLDGTEITMTMSTELTWTELGEQFRNFVSACGYIVTREDCLCSAEIPPPLQPEVEINHEDITDIFAEIIDEMEVKPKKKSKSKSKKKGIK
jgi:hypothetical protein